MDVRLTIPGDSHNINTRKDEDFAQYSIQNSEVSITGVINGKVVAMGGFCHCYPGCDHLWAIISDDLRGHGCFAVRGFKRAIENVAKNRELFRLQSYVDPKKHEYRRFIELLGFEVEGFIRKGTPLKENRLLYARIW